MALSLLETPISGDLINSGSSGGVKTDLFHIVKPGTLRVYGKCPRGILARDQVGNDRKSQSGGVFPGAAFRKSWCAQQKPSI